MEKPPLIAHVIYRLDIGGLENGLVNLINQIPENRYRHAILCLKGYSDFCLRIRREDVEIIDIDKRDGQDVGMHLRLWRAFRQLKPDIVHTRNLAALEATVAAAISGVKVRIHGEHGRDMGDLDGCNKKNQLIRRAYSPFVSHYIALSRDLESYLGEKIGVPASRITQIYNGVDTTKFYPSAGSSDDFPLAKPGQFIIGTVGRMQPVKDQLTLAKAFIRLMDIAPQFRNKARLHIIGDGPLRNESIALLEAAGYSDLAWLPGSRNDVPELMRLMDIFVLPSLAEGISNTILEAMATGLPVIATNVGGNPELVTDGSTGALIPPADPEAMAQSMLRYLSDSALAERHSNAAKRKIDARFSMEAMVGAYMQVYDHQLAIR